MRKGTSIYVSLLLVCLSLHASLLYGWNDVGHKVVASIAYEQLTPDMRAKIGMSKEAFIEGSTWLDDVTYKEGNTFLASFHSSPYPYDPEGILSDSDKKKIIDSFFDKDCLFAIHACAEVQHPLFLKMLIHLVADIHNPLHCVSFYSKQFPEGDRGGGLFLLGEEEKNLHFFSDSAFGLLAEGVDIESFAKMVTECYPKSVDKNPRPKEWQEEGFFLAVSKIYPRLHYQQSLDKRFVEEIQKEIFLPQLARAGYRLADMLYLIYSKK